MKKNMKIKTLNLKHGLFFGSIFRCLKFRVLHLNARFDSFNGIIAQLFHVQEKLEELSNSVILVI